MQNFATPLSKDCLGAVRSLGHNALTAWARGGRTGPWTTERRYG